MGKLMILDLGSFNIKTNLGGIYENRFLLDNENDTFGAETVEYHGNTYFFGKGTFSKEFVKFKKDYVTQMLYAIGKDVKENRKELNLIVLLPSTQYSTGNCIKENLSDKEFEIKVNNKYKEIKINKVGILKEGFAAFYSLPERNNGLIIIIDIGGRTTDVFAFINGNLVNEISVPVGCMDYFRRISDRLNNLGQKRKMEDIRILLDDGIIDINDFEDITNDFYKIIIDEIKIEIDNLSDFKIKLCGGGANFLIDLFLKQFDRVEKLNNNIMANVIGAYNVGKAKGLDD
ncbi:ParM/StbA family protein [Clostridium butyricum]|uniref:Uncharacterized protein n=1 Tax=Clostridium butyricum E4 str. BoNT E BL5262 TaxID=632245 RepID=C4IJJ4_CLOBU|nr:ParM/StbA family protein [Clostridium butyricum]EDT74784.1 hypothetical protein CBY_2521 [Clostridium butyricum 5521]EEP54522.1 conserved hypothetical protein [Clostridium butyricum E4 str. BoNT E BL5262]NFL30978.1 ParM/StbA family protein [Clostridium butyricum]NFS16955.1 ParM/StbA family protein [Clostridium butyricum]